MEIFMVTIIIPVFLISTGSIVLNRILAATLYLVVLSFCEVTIGESDTSRPIILLNARGETDLDVQTRMADATEDMKFWGTVSGVGALFVALLAFIASTVQWWHNRKQTRQLARASLGITDFHWIEYTVSGFSIRIGLKNNGKSEAKKIRVSYNLAKIKRPSFKSRSQWLPYTEYVPEAAPGETVTMKIGALLPRSEIEQTKSDPLTGDIVFWGIIHYEDIFEEKHQKPFRFYVTWPTFKNGVLTLNQWHTDYENEEVGDFFK